jgi:hypothetical protein
MESKKNHIHKQNKYKRLNLFANGSLATTIAMMLNLQPLQ